MNKIIFKNVEATRASAKFRRSNGVWNRGNFNRSQNIGKLMYIINEEKPESLEAWTGKYLASGSRFQKLLEEGENPDPKYYGRSMYQLKRIATSFQKAMNDAGIYTTFEEAFEYTCIRVIYETWVGYKREKAAYIELKSLCPNGYQLRHTNTSIDSTMAVDFEIVDADGEILLGIQVKGKNARESVIKSNYKRNQKYVDTYGAKVVYATIDKGHLLNKEEMDFLFRKYVH